MIPEKLRDKTEEPGNKQKNLIFPFCSLISLLLGEKNNKKLWAFLIAQLVKNLPAMQMALVWFLDWEDPLKKG